MDCVKCRSVLVDYALGELPEGDAAEFRAHIEQCEACREELSLYACLAEMVHGEPEAVPTAAESNRLRRALEGVALPQPQARRTVEAPPQGLPGFVAACVFAFTVIASLLSLVAFGVIDVRSIALETGPCTIVAVALIVVFLTSFVPIAVTARRRPLNGMTFRR